MIEHVPLAVDLTDRTVSVAVYGGRGNGVALFVDLASAPIDDGAAVGPGAERLVAVGVSQRVVRCRQSELSLFGEAAVDEYVLVLDLADAGGLEEAELVARLLLESGNHAIDRLRAGFHRCHCGRVELCPH